MEPLNILAMLPDVHATPLEGLGHRNGIQRRKLYADHEGNGNDGPADTGKPGHEARKTTQQKQGQPLHIHGTICYIEAGFLKRPEHIRARKNALHGKNVFESYRRQVHIGFGSDEAEGKGTEAQRGWPASSRYCLSCDAAMSREWP